MDLYLAGEKNQTGLLVFDLGSFVWLKPILRIHREIVPFFRARVYRYFLCRLFYSVEICTVSVCNI